MAAFNLARNLGAPGIELDIHACATGELVVAHDYTFTRMVPDGPNGGGRTIEELDLREIRALDLGAAFGSQSPVQEKKPGTAGDFSGEHPPLLEEVLENFCPAMYVDIELKSEKTKNDPLPLAAAEKLKSLGEKIAAAVTVSSFNPFALLAFKSYCPHIPTAIIWSADKAVPPILRRGLGRIISRCDYLKPVYTQVTPWNHFRFVRLESRPLVAWTVDDPALAVNLVKAGSEGIITNRPQDLTGKIFS
jgi:glycerophosphoryl diester phosphodiesterase